MSVERIQIESRLILRSPFLFPGTGAARFGLDIAAARGIDDHPLIPAEQVRGVLSHALRDMLEEGVGQLSVGWLDDLFGQASSDLQDPLASNEPRRGRLIFGDLRAETCPEADITHRVAIDAETGAARKGALVTAELVAAPGAELAFAGSIIVFATKPQAEALCGQLCAAASRVSAIGAMKSAGFGEVISWSFVPRPGRSLAVPRCDPPTERVALVVTIDRPFLVDAERVADNVYVGSPVIPGAAIKGAFARKLALGGSDVAADDALSALGISHARPEGWPDRVVPLSVVAHGKRFGDALGNPAVMIEGKAALFRPDWKESHWQQLGARHGLRRAPPIGRVERAHVGIERGGATARDEALFFTQAVEPSGRTWRVEVDFGAVPPSERGRLYAPLIDGLDGVGATGARLDFREAGAAVQDPPVRPRADGLLAVTIETEAVLATPDDGPTAIEAYSAYWKRVLGAELVDFCAEQALRGGYLGMRFRREGAGYRPFLVTLAGSVFLLRGASSEAVAALVRRGLPPPVIGGAPTDWRTCPYQPENGWGRIRADWQGLDEEAN